MTRSNFGATCRTFLFAVALTLLCDPSGGQVVEKGRTFDDLTASHPCASGLTNRIARVTDCDAADDIGDGGGAFQCWAICDGSAPWDNLALGGGGSGTIGGSTGAIDNILLRSDGTGAATVQASPLSLSDVSGVTTTLATITPAATTGASVAGQALAITASPAVASTDTAGAAAGGSVTITGGAAARNTSGNANGGDINLVPGAGVGTGTAGQVVVPVGTIGAPSVSFTGDPDTGFYWSTTNSWRVIAGGAISASFGFNQFTGSGTSILYAFKSLVAASTAGSGAPNVLTSGLLQQITTNEGSAAKNYNTLPTAAAGLTYTFVVQDADGLRVTAAAGDTIRIGAVVSSAGGYCESTTIGDSVTSVAINATEWMAVAVVGAGWTCA